MTEQWRLPVNTVVDVKDSIWHNIDQNVFRQHIIDLQRASNAVPSDPIVHAASRWLQSHPKTDDSRLLPFHVEHRLADDFAFLAAAEEGVKEVSSVALEEHRNPSSLIVLLAANERVSPAVEDTFRALFDLLSKCASRKLSRHICAESMLDRVIEINSNRIHGRLQSVLWIKPRSRIGANTREPLYHPLRKICQQLEERIPTGTVGASELIVKVRDLCNLLERLDQYGTGFETCTKLLKQIIKESYELCTLNDTSALEDTYTRYGVQLSRTSGNKYIRQVYKIGNYWGLCKSMADDSRRYPDAFTNIQLKILRPYVGATSKIALIKGQRARCLVHAEMQVIVHCGRYRSPSVIKPRVIGASKSACYLCNLFNAHHGQFFISKTHGHLYERWNFPDLADYSPEERFEYRRILMAMDTELQAATVRERNTKRRRQMPMGSWLDLPVVHQYSPIPSTLLSSQGDHNPLRIRLDACSPGPVPCVSNPHGHASSEQLRVKLSSLKLIDNYTLSHRSPPTNFSPSLACTATLTNPVSRVESLQDLLNVTVGPIKGSVHSLSNTTVDSWELPMSRNITAASPFRRKMGNLSILFEIESPAVGSLLVQESSNRSTKFPVNVCAMREGESMSFERKNGDDGVVLDLQGPDGKAVQATLCWQ